METRGLLHEKGKQKDKEGKGHKEDKLSKMLQKMLEKMRTSNLPSPLG